MAFSWSCDVTGGETTLKAQTDSGTGQSPCASAAAGAALSNFLLLALVP